MVLNLAGEVGDQLGSRCQVKPPDGMVLERWWYAREPGQRTWVGRRELWEAPVEDGGHIACGFEVAPGGGCQHEAEWVLSSFGRQGDQVGPQGRPGGFSGESGEVLVDISGQAPGTWPSRRARGRRPAESCLPAEGVRSTCSATGMAPTGIIAIQRQLGHADRAQGGGTRPP